MTKPARFAPVPAPGRRDLFRAAGAVGALAAVPGSTAAQDQPARYLTAREEVLLRAVAARLIPADAHTPSGADMGCVEFISRQLAGPFGQAARTYAEGAFAEGTPEQGWQSEWKPADLYRQGLARFDQAVPGFDAMPPAEQDRILHRLEAGEIDLGPVPAKLFFQQVLSNTTEGFFADPVYGGNRDMAAWRMIGFPGAHAAYLQEVERHNVAYDRAPVSLAELGGHGHGHGPGDGHHHAPAPSHGTHR